MFRGSTFASCASSNGRVHDRVVLVLSHQAFFTIDQELGVGAYLGALTGPRGGPIGDRQAREGPRDIPQRVGELALRGDVERIVAAHEQRVRPDLDHIRLVHAAVHALAADEEDQVRREPGGLLEIFCHGIVAAVERMARREVREDVPAREHRRLEQLGQPHGLGLRALAPDVVAEHQYRALRLAEAPGDRLHRVRARRPRPLDPVVGAFADLRLQPFTSPGRMPIPLRTRPLGLTGRSCSQGLFNQASLSPRPSTPPVHTTISVNSTPE